MSDQDRPDMPINKTRELEAVRFEPAAAPTNETRSFKLKPVTIATSIATAFIAYILFFLLTAKSVEIDVRATTAGDVSISGLAVPFGGRFLIRPGDYELEVSAEGYVPFEGVLEVTRADSQTRSVVLKPLPGILGIQSNPAGADVVLDGIPIGTTPTTIKDVEAGNRALTLTLQRYQPLTIDLAVEGRGREQAVTLDLLTDWAEVTLTTEPAEASITLNSQLIERRGAVVELPSGNRIITVSAPGHESTDIELLIEANIPQDLGLVRLKPSDGALILTSQPSGASVTQNGDYIGITPLQLSLAPNRSHQISLSKAGYERRRFSSTLERGSSSERLEVLAPILGEVRVAVVPSDATVTVNGDNLGTGSMTLTLPAIEQEIVVSKPGYASQIRTLTPRAGLAQEISLALLTDEEARKAAIKSKIISSLGQTLLLIDPAIAETSEFTMGAPRRAAGRGANEVERQVKLKRAFYLASSETTNAQFRQFTADHNSGQAGGNSLNREFQPAVKLSWQQAASFCNWLSRKEGLAPFYLKNQGIIVGFNADSLGYRLPSEAEWAYASRVEGASMRRFAWGEAWPPEDNSSNLADSTAAIVTGRVITGYSDGHIVSAPVASFPQNHRELHDMGGNVAEWVNDVYRVPVPGAAIAVDPLGDEQGDNYTIRGASWSMSRLRELRLTYRDYGERGRDDVGFRIARYAE